LSTGDVPIYLEERIYEGCYVADSTFFQTQHGPGANDNSCHGIPTGYSLIGPTTGAITRMGISGPATDVA